MKVLGVEIYGFVRDGIDFEATNSGAKLLVADSHIFNNTGDGILVAPPAGGNSTATVRNNLIVGNGCGIVATNHLADAAFNFAANCGTQLAGVGGTAKVNAFGNQVSDSDLTGGATLHRRLRERTEHIRNRQQRDHRQHNGMKAIDPGAFGGIFSFGDNYAAGNVTNGTANGGIAKI